MTGRREGMSARERRRLDMILQRLEVLQADVAGHVSGETNDAIKDGKSALLRAWKKENRE